MIVVIVVALVREMVLPAAAMLGGVVVLVLVGVIDFRAGFSGFANEAPWIIAALLVLARAVDLSGLLQPIVGALFGASRSATALMARLVVPVGGVSGFMNNTTVVAMTVPTVIELSRRRGLAPSRFLIPVSYAAILGGVITTIGTSTNLTVSGLLSDAGMAPLGLFEITPVGLPVALLGLAAVIVLAPRLLPERGERRDDSITGGREFTVSMSIVSGGPLDGVSIED
ncbi:MAG TPA: SLC13 family permease, partial [Candidatus Limnocylindrales bacterium]